MIKLKTLIPEAYKHYLYGDDTSHWTVKKPFDVYVYGDKDIPTGQWSTAGPGGNKMIYTKELVRYRLRKGQQISNIPGGVFIVDYKEKWAGEISYRKRATGKPKDLEPRTSKIIDYSLWKKWLTYKK
jgi:hypothetical protein